ncbi:hypothetical protein IFM89_001037 [Coptis chinensis]|uniref:F-box domain-containing protein n=1 Tax=Coptis chinensis TaxID=261450 RepID=A0A835GWM3_9MAGN|nr:hypothetical protein IFM89_001037 [Coptis chinensis]
MGGSGSVPNSRKKEMSLGGQNGGEDVDRISCLPDNILHHILSFLPTKYAVGSSVLSTKWKYLWTSVPKLELSDSLLYSTKIKSGDPMVKASFMNFVDRVLLLHEASSIHKFSLECAEAYDVTRFNAWISAVLKRNVQELILSVCMDPFVFPLCRFNCQSLTTLKIDVGSACFWTPTSMCFPKLKVLNLKDVIFCGDLSIQQAFFSFPVLEEFHAYSIEWEKFNTVNISAPTLKKLILDVFDDSYTVEDCEINIYTENLIYFELASQLAYWYNLHNLSSLVEARIGCKFGHNYHRISKFFGKICNVKVLHLSIHTITDFFELDTIGDYLPEFASLTDLRVFVDCDDYENNFDFGCLISILHKMPNINSFIFEAPVSCVLIEHGPTLEIVPQCVQSHLKSVELRFYTGSDLELCLVKFLLKNAMALEKITVMASWNLSRNPEMQVEVFKQLLRLPRGSACSVIDFC